VTEPGAPTTRTFEQVLSRLEAIVKEMEAGTLDLETLLARFEEGQALVKWCGEKLNQVERRIEVLMKDGQRIVTAPFTTPAGAAGEPEAPAEDRGSAELL